jgi:hypothetical protein
VSAFLVAAVITLYAQAYDVPTDYALCIAQAESSLDTHAVNGEYVGPWQWGIPFWEEMRAEMGRDPDPDLRYDLRESTQTAMYAFRRGFQYKWSTDCLCGGIYAEYR